MCACDERLGRKYLPHQLGSGRELETQLPVPLTHGFQPKICHECRGLPPEAHPVSESHGRTSKIRRYYWRELAFRKMELFGEWAAGRGLDPRRASGPEAAEARKRAGELALAEIKKLHAKRPKYVFREESQAEVIAKYGVEVLDLQATYIAGEKRHGDPRVVDGSEPVTIEEYAIRQVGAGSRPSALRAGRFTSSSESTCGSSSKILQTPSFR